MGAYDIGLISSAKRRDPELTGQPRSHRPDRVRRWTGSEFRVLTFRRKREAGIITAHLTSPWVSPGVIPSWTTMCFPLWYWGSSHWPTRCGDCCTSRWTIPGWTISGPDIGDAATNGT